MLVYLLVAALLADATKPPLPLTPPAATTAQAPPLPQPIPPQPTTTQPPAPPAPPPAPTPSSCMLVACSKQLTKGSTKRTAVCPDGDVAKMLTFDFGSTAAPIIACLCCPKVSTPPRVSDMEEAKP